MFNHTYKPKTIHFNFLFNIYKMSKTKPFNPITGQILLVDDIVAETENKSPSPLQTEETENEFGSRGYDKQYDGAYADD